MAHGPAHALGRVRRALIADEMTEAVVDPLEVVEVDEQDADLFGGGAESAGEALVERGAIGELGERVGEVLVLACSPRHKCVTLTANTNAPWISAQMMGLRHSTVTRTRPAARWCP